MGLGDLIGSVTGLDEQRSSLKGFLSKFNQADTYANTIDPLHTFDVTFEFWPKFGSGGDDSNGLLSMIKDAGMSIGNSITGGLLGSIMKDMSNNSITKLRDDFKSDNNGDEQTSFVDFLARGNYLNANDGDLQKPQLILDFSYYTQDMQLPQIAMKDGGTVETMVGDFPVNGRIVQPSQNTFQMTIINTKAPLMERIFYPWMREVTMPYWSYNTQPYTTADVKVSFEKHTDMKYVFVGARPQNIEALGPSNELKTPTRTVTFVFDYMFVTSGLKTYEKTTDKLLDVGKSALNGAGSLLGL